MVISKHKADYAKVLTIQVLIEVSSCIDCLTWVLTPVGRHLSCLPSPWVGVSLNWCWYV